MKIIHISVSNKLGGAGIASNRLHKEFINLGLDSTLIVLNEENIDKNVIEYKSFFSKQLLRLIRKFESRVLKFYSPLVGAFSLNIFGIALIRKVKKYHPDVVYIHWVNSGYLSIRTLGKILDLNIPVYFFLHDMWLLTGGCHHSFDCEKYTLHCNSCVNLNSRFKYDISFVIFMLKKNYLSNYKNVRLIAPSSWMAERAHLSKIFSGSKIRIIPNFIDTEIFKQIDKKIARSVLKLDEDANIVLFGADMAKTNPYKGWQYLAEALELINTDTLLVTFGSENFDYEGQNVNFGVITDEKLLVLLYNASDVFVMPSLAESFGQTALESLSCGTPVVSFRVGGLVDLIIHKKNGYLANYKDANDLASGISWVFENDMKEISLSAISYVKENFCKKVVIQKHLALWN
jgi:glycosyltransferase involved in cell wall biosynthesis